MNYNDMIDLQMFIGALLDHSNIKSGKALTDFATELHDILEDEIQDYADDNDLDDYDPCY